MYLAELIFCDKRKFKLSNMTLWYETNNKETIYIDTLLICTLWYEFSNAFDVQIDFGKHFVTKNVPTWTILISSML